MLPLVINLKLYNNYTSDKLKVFLCKTLDDVFSKLLYHLVDELKKYQNYIELLSLDNIINFDNDNIKNKIFDFAVLFNNKWIKPWYHQYIYFETLNLILNNDQININSKLSLVINVNYLSDFMYNIFTNYICDSLDDVKKKLINHLKNNFEDVFKYHKTYPSTLDKFAILQLESTTLDVFNYSVFYNNMHFKPWNEEYLYLEIIKLYKKIRFESNNIGLVLNIYSDKNYYKFYTHKYKSLNKAKKNFTLILNKYFTENFFVITKKYPQSYDEFTKSWFKINNVDEHKILEYFIYYNNEWIRPWSLEDIYIKILKIKNVYIDSNDSESNDSDDSNYNDFESNYSDDNNFESNYSDNN